MALPVRVGDPTAPTRLDSARIELEALQPDRVYLFGDNPIPVRLDSLGGIVAEHGRSRLEPALQAAKLGGADSVWVFTDGDLGDRASALETAEGLGLGVREIRVAVGAARIGLATITAPERARAGDTVRVTVEFRTGGEPNAQPDTVRLAIERDGEVVATARAPRPAPGRTGRAELAFVPSNPDDEPVWQRYDAVLVDPVDPLGVSNRVSAWIEVSESTGGAVFVSTVPDWEARFVVPALSRLVLGGARGFLRLADGRYLEMGASPRIVEEARVRNSIRGSRLLVAQIDPSDLPAWLDAALRTHARTLVFAEGPGELSGSGVRVTGPLPGEWYAMAPIPASPARALLAEGDLDPLPPVRELYAVEPPGRWTVLNANRNRRGEPRPLLTAGESGDRRWAVSVASDWWRWSLRGGASKRVYDGAFSGVVGWLVEDATPQLATLVVAPTVGLPPVWRIRPGATALTVRIVDSEGAEVWTQTAADPDAQLTGPLLATGTYEATVTATGPDGPLEVRRPIEVKPDPRELLPAAPAELATVAAVVQERPRVEIRAPRPVWPFVLAVLLLCGEWIWRHRIGLR